MCSAFSIDFLEPTSEFQMLVSFLLVDKHIKCEYSFPMKILVIYWQNLLKCSLSMVSVLADIAHYATSSLISNV